METFASTEVATTIYWMMKYLGIMVTGRDYYGRIKFTYEKNIHSLLKEMEQFSATEKDLLHMKEKVEPFKTKYSDYLPKELLDEIHAERVFNIKRAVEFINKIDRVSIM